MPQPENKRIAGGNRLTDRDKEFHAAVETGNLKIVKKDLSSKLPGLKLFIKKAASQTAKRPYRDSDPSCGLTRIPG